MYETDLPDMKQKLLELLVVIEYSLSEIKIILKTLEDKKNSYKTKTA